MTSAIVEYVFEDITVRTTVDNNGEIWFIATDIARVLGYSKVSNMVRMVDEDERGAHIVSTSSGNKTVTILNESGVNHVILNSKRSEAIRFRKWLTKEVIPTIMKTGSYSTVQPSTESTIIPTVPDNIQPVSFLTEEQKTRLSEVEYKVSMDKLLSDSDKLQKQKEIREIRFLLYKTKLSLNNDKLQKQKELQSVQHYLSLGKLLGTEEHLSKAIVVSKLQKTLGVSYEPLLKDNLVQEVLLNPTALGKLVDLKPTEINKLLVSYGYQVKVGNKYQPTEKAEGYCSLSPFQSRYSEHVGSQLLWFKKILDTLGLGSTIKLP
jgi:prophage antirepressor-like protein